MYQPPIEYQSLLPLKSGLSPHFLKREHKMETPKSVSCPRCERVLEYTKENFPVYSYDPFRLQKKCRLCRSEIGSEAQHKSNKYQQIIKKEVVNRFKKHQ